MIALESSLSMLPHIRFLCGNFQSELFQTLYRQLDPLEDIYELIHNAIVEEPPISVREGGIFKSGFHEEIDRLRNAKTEGKDWLADLEAKEKEKSGIKNLRIKFNKVFGYYLEDADEYRTLYHAGIKGNGRGDTGSGGSAVQSGICRIL